jgi:hypothetical protein
VSNDLFKALTALAVFAEAVALIFALARRDLRVILFVNLAGAAAILFLQLPHLRFAIENADLGVLGILAFALITIATTLLWFVSSKWLSFLVWIEFAVHTLLSLALLVFAFTFSMMRMM